MTFDFDGTAALVIGANDMFGGAITRAFHGVDVSVATVDVVGLGDEDDLSETEKVRFYGGDFTDKDDVAHAIDEVVSGFGCLDHLTSITGARRGGTPIGETDADTSDFLFDVNLKAMFLASKHAIPHLQEIEDFVVSVSARSSLENGEGDGIYHVSRVGVHLLTETIAGENRGDVRTGAAMPSVIDTLMNHGIMTDADFNSWVKPTEIARTVLALYPNTIPVINGATVPVYGEA